MSYLCLRCGFQEVPDCPCKAPPAPEPSPEPPVMDMHKASRIAAQEAAINAVREWIQAGTEGAKAAGTVPDMVNHPPHYASGAVECIDAIHAAIGDDGLIAYCRGAAMKYLWRMDKKGNAVQDLEKAVWYITKAVEVARGTRP